MKPAAFLILVPVLLLLSKCAAIQAQHNSAAQQMLLSLQQVPLPAGSRVICEKAEVGCVNSRAGDAIDTLAYRAFRTDLPAKEVAELLTRVRSAETQTYPRRLAVCSLDQPPRSPALPVELILSHIAAAERSRTYILYTTAHQIEDGRWDPRGW